MKHTIRQELHWVLLLVGAMWLVALTDLVLPIDLNRFGLIPRTIGGLIGIPCMPFLHGGWGHLFNNTVPLLILLCLLAGSRADSRLIVAGLIALGGLLLWLFGRSSVHIGASGLVYGLVAFLIAAGFLERRLVASGVAILVGVLYGTTLLWGILPSSNSSVSWDGHLFGAIAGVMLSYSTATKTDASAEQTA